MCIPHLDLLIHELFMCKLTIVWELMSIPSPGGSSKNVVFGGGLRV